MPTVQQDCKGVAWHLLSQHNVCTFSARESAHDASCAGSNQRVCHMCKFCCLEPLEQPSTLARSDVYPQIPIYHERQQSRHMKHAKQPPLVRSDTAAKQQSMHGTQLRHCFITRVPSVCTAVPSWPARHQQWQLPVDAFLHLPGRLEPPKCAHTARSAHNYYHPQPHATTMCVSVFN